MKRILLSISTFALLVFIGLFFNLLFFKKEFNAPRATVLIDNIRFEVEIADEPLEQARGLSGRKSLGEREGMLFIFPDLANRTFWMSGMKFPLDIIWIRGDIVAGFAENIPPAAGIPKIYSSPEPVDKVLEINAGLIKKLEIKIGDKIKF